LYDIIQSEERKLYRSPSTGRGGFMNIRGINDVYGVGELEATGSALIEAHERGHDLGEWGPTIGERMRFAKCRRCGRLVWIVRPPGVESWRVGGNALNADCALGFGRRPGS
jgi:hypothetical protein